MNKPSRPNFELLRSAFAIISGIPDERLNLNSWRNDAASINTTTIHCGTICCAAGWLVLHPEFKALGLRPHFTGAPMFEDEAGSCAMRVLFDIPHSDMATGLFSSTTASEFDRELTDEQMKELGDKKLFLRRVLRYFQKYNEPFDPKVGRGLLLDARNA